MRHTSVTSYGTTITYTDEKEVNMAHTAGVNSSPEQEAKDKAQAEAAKARLQARLDQERVDRERTKQLVEQTRP